MDQQEQNSRLMRSTFHVALPTFLSRILGYLRDMLQAKYMGTTGVADAFNIAFMLPNLLRRLTGEGAMTAAFIPVFTQLKKDKTKEEMWKFANIFFFDLTLIMAVLAVVGILFAPVLVKFMAVMSKNPVKWELATVLTRIMFPYMFLVSLAALAMAILNSFKQFFIPAFTPVLFNLAIITAALLFAQRAAEPAYVFSAGVVVGGVFQLAIQIPSLWKRGMRFSFGLSFRHPAVRKVGRLMAPGIFAVGIAQINFVLSRMMAWSIDEGSVSSLYFSIRVQELTLGIFSIAFSIALLPTFSEQAADRDIPSMKRTLQFSVKVISFITLPAMVGLMVLNRPIVQVLFQRGLFDAHSTQMTSSCLLFLALGLPFLSYVKIFAPAFFSLKDTKTPVIVAFFVMLSYIGLAFLLMGSMRVAGLALALAVSNLLNFLGLFLLLERKIGRVEKKDTLFSVSRSAAAAAVMGLCVWFFIKRFSFSNQPFLKNLEILVASIVLGLGVYLALAAAFNRDVLLSVKTLFSREKILKEKNRR